MEFRLGPRIQPAVDSRIELLPAERWREYLAIAAGRWDAERLLDRWGIDYVVTRRAPDAFADRAPGRLGTLAAGVLRPRRTSVRTRGAANDR